LDVTTYAIVINSFVAFISLISIIGSFLQLISENQTVIINVDKFNEKVKKRFDEKQALYDKYLGPNAQIGSDEDSEETDGKKENKDDT
jgi:hypothetical protein